MENEFGDQTHPEDVGGIQSFPVLDRDESGKLTPDCMAAVAIQGMLPGKVADEAEKLEAEYQTWKVTDPRPQTTRWDWVFAAISHGWFVQSTRYRNMWLTRGTNILREQVALLALGYQEARSDLKAQQVRSGFYDQYLKMQEGNTKFRAFLLENFPEEMKVADATNQPLIQFAQGLMLQLKSKQ